MLTATQKADRPLAPIGHKQNIFRILSNRQLKFVVLYDISVFECIFGALVDKLVTWNE